MLDYLNALEQLDLPFETLQRMLVNLNFNDTIAEYFDMYAEETGEVDFKRVGNRVRECLSYVFTKRYETEKVLNIETVFCCTSKFCPNCLKLIQANRLKKMFNTINEATQNYNLYHVVFTVPNVGDNDLDYTTDIMAEAFSKLIRYFSGNAKISGIDFKKLGYFAAIRSLEITYSTTRKDYHPHYHCVFALSKDFELDKIHVNQYSYNAKQNYALVRKFSDFEILLQLLWRQLIDNIRERDILDCIAIKNSRALASKLKKPLTARQIGKAQLKETLNNDFTLKRKKVQAKKVTLEVLQSLGVDGGFSVIADKADDSNVYEVFKYAFKLTSEQQQIMQYEQFKTLLKVMRKRKQIQCYGGWYDMKLDDSIDTETIEALFLMIIDELEKDNEQTTCCTTIQDILEYKKRGWAVISKRQIMKLLKYLDDSQLRQAITDVYPLIKTLRETKRGEMALELHNKYKSGLHNRYTAPIFGEGSLEKMQLKKQEYIKQRISEHNYDEYLKKTKADEEISKLTEEELQVEMDKIF